VKADETGGTCDKNSHDNGPAWERGLPDARQSRAPPARPPSVLSQR
jgi:hypothetical protein